LSSLRLGLSFTSGARTIIALTCRDGFAFGDFCYRAQILDAAVGAGADEERSSLMSVILCLLSGL